MKKLMAWAGPVLAVPALFAFVEATTRFVWRPERIGARAERLDPDYGFGFELSRPLCYSDGGEKVCPPTQYRSSLWGQRFRLPKPAGAAVRFVVLGGSVSEGPRSYPQIAAARLGAESINFSQSGFGTTRMRAALPESLSYAPDLVMLDCTGTNEYEDERDEALLYAPRHAGIWAAVYQSWAVTLLAKAMLPRPAASSAFADYPSEEVANRSDVNRRRWLDTLDENVRGMITLARAHDVEVVLIGRALAPTHPMRGYVERLNRLLRGYALSYPGAHFFDTARAVGARPWFDSGGAHFNAAGHAGVGEALAGELATESRRRETARETD